MKTKKYPSWLKVKRSRAGLGLVTTKDLKKGDFIIEYTGEKITTEEADQRGGQYLFTLNDDYIIDGKGRENLARYINHSCRPNSEPEIDEDKWKINIYAKRNIKAGEELNYDYGKDFWNDYIKPKGCLCDKCLEKRSK